MDSASADLTPSGARTVQSLLPQIEEESQEIQNLSPWILDFPRLLHAHFHLTSDTGTKFPCVFPSHVMLCVDVYVCE